MAGQQSQPKYGFGWPDGRLAPEARPLFVIQTALDVQEVMYQSWYIGTWHMVHSSQSYNNIHILLEIKNY